MSKIEEKDATCCQQEEICSGVESCDCQGICTCDSEKVYDQASDDCDACCCSDDDDCDEDDLECDAE